MVKSNGAFEIAVYEFLVAFKSNVWHSLAPLRYKTLVFN